MSYDPVYPPYNFVAGGIQIIKNTLVYKELTDKPFCVKEIKKCINKL
jgi:hypothetical protein